MRALPDGALRLGAPVRRIERTADRVAVRTPAGTVRAGHAVLAIPPQLIGRIDVAPALPAAHRDAFERFVPGAVIKTVAVFERPWWRERGYAGSVVAPHTPWPTVVDGGGPTQGPADAPGVLVALSTADAAVALSRIPPERRADAFLARLPALFGAEPIQTPRTVRVVDWSADPWSLGGYASRPGLGHPCVAPDPVGRLHFAGTETADEWRSHLEGALQAGERAAAAIAGSGAAV